MLDEFEVVQSQEVLDAVAFVLDHQLPNLHRVLCTRGEPRLPLPRLRARGQLAGVTAEDLRFTVDEAARFLEERDRDRDRDRVFLSAPPIVSPGRAGKMDNSPA